MSAAPPAIVPGSPRVRVIVDFADSPDCVLRVGDFFDVDGSELRLPAGRPFCPEAIVSVVPVLGMRQADLPEDDWLARKPWLCCPVAGPAVTLRVERLEPGTPWPGPEECAEITRREVERVAALAAAVGVSAASGGAHPDVALGEAVTS